MQVTNEQLATTLESIQDGKIFSVKFVKRTDGTVRDMVCRLGVQKGVKGVGHSFDPKAKRLLCVYEMPKDQFRMINLTDLLAAKVEGQEYEVV